MFHLYNILGNLRKNAEFIYWTCKNIILYSSLRSVIEKPPIGGKELLPLTSVQLAGFRLHPGPVSRNSISHQDFESKTKDITYLSFIVTRTISLRKPSTSKETQKQA